jgi:hypothetical protein
MSNSEPVAIVRKVFTISITFVNKPSDARRQQLKGAGYRFENGNWYKSDTEGKHADDATVADLIAAS